ncbi:MAG: VWA domain-containing protein [Chloroflexota bacterium]
MIEFASPWYLLLLLGIPLLAMARYGHWRWRQPAALRYSSVKQLAFEGRTWRQLLQPLLPIMRWLALGLAVIALARPQIVDAQQIIRGEGVDISLALDISSSMASLDFEPDNRLETAKNVIKDFVQERSFDRIGLTVFAAEAFSQSPLTIDHAVLARLLGDVQLATDLNINDGTAIGLGVANAANMLKDSQAKSKIVVLLTDGVNNAGQIDPLTAAEAAKTLGIKVYTIGAGRRGQVPVPQRDIFGERIVMMESVIDEETLEQIAEITGGRFYRAEDAQGLRQIYEEINQLEKSEIEIRTFKRYTELAAWFLVPGILLLMLEMLLKQSVLRSLP